MEVFPENYTGTNKGCVIYIFQRLCSHEEYTFVPTRCQVQPNLAEKNYLKLSTQSTFHNPPAVRAPFQPNTLLENSIPP